MCSEKGYAHTEQGKEERRKKGYTGLCSLMETSILLIQFLNFYLYLFVFVCFVYACGLHIHLLVQICVDVFAHMCIPEDNLIPQHSQGTVHPSFSQWSAICQAD